MNQLKFLIILLFSFSGYALSFGMCRPLPSTKIYIENDFSMNYPRTVVFSCEYECNINEDIVRTRGTSRVTVSNVNSDSLMVVCQGVKVKKVSWGYDFDRIENFFIYDTRVQELRTLAKKNLMPLDTPESRALLHKAKSNLASVASAYIMAGNGGTSIANEFKEAGEVLKKISEELPDVTQTLDLYLVDLKDDYSLYSNLTAKNLIMRTLLQELAWRRP